MTGGRDRKKGLSKFKGQKGDECGQSTVGGGGGTGQIKSERKAEARWVRAKMVNFVCTMKEGKGLNSYQSLFLDT